MPNFQIEEIDNFPGDVFLRGTFFVFSILSTTSRLGETGCDGLTDTWLLYIWIWIQAAV
jgi:hypothetical protein